MQEVLHELNITDLGGVQPDPAELYHEELIAWVNDLNPDLGTENDPFYNEYKAFKDEINNAKIITLDAEAYKPSNKYDEIDLSGEDKPIADLSALYMMFMGTILFTHQGVTPYDLVSGDEYAPFTDRGLAPMDDTTVPA